MGKKATPATKHTAPKARKTATERTPTEVTRQYARILGEHGAEDRRLSDVVRVCLRAIARRLPLGSRLQREAEALLDRVIRLGELGALDLIGTAPAISTHIAAMLHEEPLDPRGVYRVLKALYKKTSLVDHPSRMVWMLRLSGLCDPSSPLHQALLAETPSPYHLPERPDESDAPHRAQRRDDPLVALRAELIELRRAQAEDRRRLARIEAELAALREQLAGKPTPPAPDSKFPPQAEVAADEVPPEVTSIPSDGPPLKRTDTALQEAEPLRDAPEQTIADLASASPAPETSSSRPKINGTAETIEVDDAESGDGDEADEYEEDAAKTAPNGPSAQVAVTTMPPPPTRRRKRKRRRRGGAEPPR